MDLKRISNAELTLSLEKLVRSERKLTHIILIHIVEVESRRLYAESGFDGMFSYLTKGLGYSESAAYRRLKSARLLKKVPELAQSLEKGSLNLSQLAQVQKCIEFENPTSNSVVQTILAKVENKNLFETKKILAMEFNQPIKTITVFSPQHDESVRVELTFTKKQFEALQEAKSNLSHTIHNNSLPEVIEYLTLKFNAKNKRVSSIEKIEELSIEKSKNKNLKEMTLSFAATKVKRIALSIKIRRAVMEKGKHACQYVDKKTGHRCNSNYQLQVDHIHPLSGGGSNDIENLQILCRTHNFFKGARTISN